MTIETHLHRARERVESEQETVVAKCEAFGTFGERVESLSTVRPEPETATATVAGSIASGTARAGTDQCEAVLSAFADTVGPHVGDTDGSVLGGVRTELGDSVALALAPTTGSALTPTLQTQLLSAVQARQKELSVTETALGRERESLDDATAVGEDCTDWLVRADVTPLSSLGFETLQNRHERLTESREHIEAATSERQEFLHATTSLGAEVGVDHHSLAESLYEDFPVDHPVLATATRLDDILEECQRAVRDHLVRRA